MVVEKTTRTNKEDCDSIGRTTVDLVTAIAKSLSGKDEKCLDGDLLEQIGKLGRCDS